METIARLAELFMNEEDVAAIMAATSKDDILRILAQLLSGALRPTEEENMKILVVCGHGLGTSLMMEMSIKSIQGAGRDGRGGSPIRPPAASAPRSLSPPATLPNSWSAWGGRRPAGILDNMVDKAAMKEKSRHRPARAGRTSNPLRLSGRLVSRRFHLLGADHGIFQFSDV